MIPSGNLLTECSMWTFVPCLISAFTCGEFLMKKSVNNPPYLFCGVVYMIYRQISSPNTCRVVPSYQKIISHMCCTIQLIQLIFPKILNCKFGTQCTACKTYSRIQVPHIQACPQTYHLSQLQYNDFLVYNCILNEIVTYKDVDNSP